MAAQGAGEVDIDDAELDALIEEYKKMKESGHLDDLDEDFSNHPFFMDHMPTEEEYATNPYLKALRNLDYSDDHGPADLALDCKERGNTAFRRGKAFYGNALKCYNDALRHIRNADPSPEMTALESVVHANLAAILISRKKLSLALDECGEALTLNPQNVKAALRGAKCALDLGRYSRASELAAAGLAVDAGHAKLAAIAKAAAAGTAKVHRMQAAEKAKGEALAARLATAQSACAERGIRVGAPLFTDMRRAADEPHITQDGCMHWPLVVLYPESGQSDYVQAWPEVESVGALLGALLPPTRGGGPPLPWDKAGSYALDNVDVFYVRDIVPPRPLDKAWDHWLPASMQPPAEEGGAGAAAAPAGDKPNQWVQIPFAAPLLLPLVQPDHVVPCIPVLYVVGKGSSWYTAWRQETLRSMKAPHFPALTMPDLPTREEFEAAQ